MGNKIMSKFKNFNEAFNDPFDYVSEKRGRSLRFLASYGDDNEKELEIYFWDHRTYVELTFNVDGSQKTTGKGDAFRIFATVKDAMIKNLKHLNQYKDIRFDAKKTDKSRVKLYRTLAKQLQRKLGLKSVEEHDQKNDILFIISNGE